jgi:hypothetical protein
MWSEGSNLLRHRYGLTHLRNVRSTGKRSPWRQEHTENGVKAGPDEARQLGTPLSPALRLTLRRAL